jgi:hypothetical protein
MKSTMHKNHFGDEVEFEVGNRVIYVDEYGYEFRGTLLEIHGELGLIDFSDGGEEWEKLSEMYVTK